MAQNFQMPSAKAVISTAASVAATAMVVRSFANEFIPHELRDYVLTKFRSFLTTFSNDIIIVIDEFDGLTKNELFRAAEIYLGTVISPSTKRFRAVLPTKEKKINVSMERNEELIDEFCGFQVKWRFVSKQIQPRYVTYEGDSLRSELQFYEISIHNKHRDKVLDEYFPYVLAKSKAAVSEKKTLKLYSYESRMMSHRGGSPWKSVNLDHPATFDTLAMDESIKNMIISDLDRFVQRKELYRKVGKAWKRGYLLFGPPGTGKSSLIAAMANYLNFDIYDLELTDTRSNTELRRLLISTANQSILVVEDIDCSIELTEKRANKSSSSIAPMHPRQNSQGGERVTLSGLLNFIDGLWSSCGDERIIVFTTNHKDKLDPALLRPGRMDVHIHMSYCTPCGFKLLASNYLGISEHPLFSDVERRMRIAKVTPAEVGEQLLKYGEPETALKGLIEFLEEKKKNFELLESKRKQQQQKLPTAKAEEEAVHDPEKNVETMKQELLPRTDTTEVVESESESEKKQDGIEMDAIFKALVQMIQAKKESEVEVEGGKKPESGSSLA